MLSDVVQKEERGSLSLAQKVSLFSGMFLISWTVMVFEITLTRIFAVLFLYHYAFIAVSFAILGLGIGGLLSYRLRWLRPVADTQRLLRVLSLSSLVFGITLGLATATILHFTNAMRILPFAAIALVPFVCGGVILSSAFRGFADESNRLYFYDLGGASVGCLTVVLALQFLGGVDTLLLLSGTASLGGLCFTVTLRREYIVAGIAACVLCTIGFILNIQHHILDLNLAALKVAMTKTLVHDLRDVKSGRIIYSDWSAYSRTDVLDDGLGKKLILYTDGGAGASMLRFDGDFSKVAFLKRRTLFFPYYFGTNDKVLIIGSGGGIDVLGAWMGGSKEITAVEINPSIVQVVKKFADYNGGIYNWRNVHVYVTDGRSFIERSPERYDLICLPLVFTQAAGAVGYSLMENYIFTTEAFERYFEHLNPGGRLAMVFHDQWELLKAFTTLVGVITANGEPEDEAVKHIVVVGEEGITSRGLPEVYAPLLMVGKDRFTPAESEDMLKVALSLGLEPFFFPYWYEKEPFFRITSWGVKVFASKSPENIYPATDDRPFFYNMSKGIHPDLRRLLIGTLGVVGVFIVLPSLRRRIRLRRADGPRIVSFVLYFSAIGMGYMLIETYLLQKFILFLGYPTLTFSVTLFSLLLSGAMGSLAGSWLLGIEASRSVCVVCLLIAMLIVLYAFFILGLLEKALPLGISVRSLIAMALIAPLGFLMGIPFPTGLRLLTRCSGDEVPWMWSVNGIMSVMGSVLAVTVAMVCGFRMVLFLGAVCYLFVAALFFRSKVVVAYRAMT